MRAENGFEIVLISPFFTRGSSRKIHFDGKYVATVNQKRGPGLFDVETPGTDSDESLVVRRVDLAGFVRAPVCR